MVIEYFESIASCSVTESTCEVGLTCTCWARNYNCHTVQSNQSRKGLKSANSKVTRGVFGKYRLSRCVLMLCQINGLGMAFYGQNSFVILIAAKALRLMFSCVPCLYICRFLRTFVNGISFARRRYGCRGRDIMYQPAKECWFLFPFGSLFEPF